MNQAKRIKTFKDMHFSLTDPVARENATRVSERKIRMEEKMTDTGYG